MAAESVKHTPHAPQHASKGWLAGAGAFAAAFLANSHHSLHMLLLSLGIGGSAFFLAPSLRLGMVLVSLAMTGAGIWWLWRHPRRSQVEGWAILASLYASILLIAWTVLAHA